MTANPQPEREEMIEVAEDAMMRIVIGVQVGGILPHDVHKEAVALAGFVFAHFVSKDVVREAVRNAVDFYDYTSDVEIAHDVGDNILKALGLDKPERTE